MGNVPTTANTKLAPLPPRPKLRERARTTPSESLDERNATEEVDYLKEILCKHESKFTAPKSESLSKTPLEILSKPIGGGFGQHSLVR